MNDQDTICAISTATGGAIGIIRLSGSKAIQLADGLFQNIKCETCLENKKAGTVTFGRIMDKEEVLDEVLVSLFRAPHSYTGEDCIEIACHGSSYILQRVLQLLVDKGCRMALPGEFTQRAFLNGKMDLSQAEAVADLVASSSKASHSLAINQMRGGFSNELRELRNKLLEFTSLLELELDFSDHEDVIFADRTQMKALAGEIQHTIKNLADSFSVGNAIKNGVPTTIVGHTNVGKSTLLNTLLGEQKALVSDINGTTRDAIEDTFQMGGILFRFIDTAGIRKTSDVVESMGIERTYEKIAQSDIVLWMVDACDMEHQILELEDQILEATTEKSLILVVNKEDLVEGHVVIPTLKREVPVVSISAKKGKNLEALKSKLIECAGLPEISQKDVIVTNIRHYQALKNALESINRVIDGLTCELSGDLIAQDSRECIHHLGDIVGEVTTNEVLENIFSHFCIGK